MEYAIISALASSLLLSTQLIASNKREAASSNWPEENRTLERNRARSEVQGRGGVSDRDRREQVVGYCDERRGERKKGRNLQRMEESYQNTCQSRRRGAILRELAEIVATARGTMRASCEKSKEDRCGGKKN